MGAVKRSLERLFHFRCVCCSRWWSIGDAPETKEDGWYCPWCGHHHAQVEET